MQSFAALRGMHGKVRVPTLTCSRLREASKHLREDGERASTSKTRAGRVLSRE